MDMSNLTQREKYMFVKGYISAHGVTLKLFGEHLSRSITNSIIGDFNLRIGSLRRFWQLPEPSLDETKSETGHLIEAMNLAIAEHGAQVAADLIKERRG